MTCRPAAQHACLVSQKKVETRTHIPLGVTRDEHMELLLFSIVILGIPGSTLLDRPLAPDGDLGVGLLLHPLLGVAPRPDDQADEVVAGVGGLGDEDLAMLLGGSVVVGRAVGGVILDQLLNQLAAPVHQLVLAPHLQHATRHDNTQKQCQSTGRTHAEVLQNLMM